MSNRQTDGECTTGATERSESETADHVSGDCGAAENEDDKTKHEKSNTASREPPAAASLSDGNC